MVSIKNIGEAYNRIHEVVNETPLFHDPLLSGRYQAKILLKREELQIVRSYKLRSALREFVNEILGPDDDITYFEYTTKNNRENGPALVGIETRSRSDFEAMVQRMQDKHISYKLVNDSPDLFHFLI